MKQEAEGTRKEVPPATRLANASRKGIPAVHGEEHVKMFNGTRHLLIGGSMLTTPAGRFRLLALTEAVSWAGLLVGMFFKYVVIGNDIGVSIFGPIHGAVFLAYVLAAILVRRPLAWTPRTLVLALVSSVPPFGSVVFERWASRTGRLNTAARAMAA